MNNSLKYALFGLGGFGLFLVTFTLVAVFSGAPLHEVAGIRMFVEAPEKTAGIADSSTDSADPTQADPDAPVEPVSGTEALMRNAGMLTAWSLPSPFTGNELHKLQKELTDQIRENKLERERLRVRGLELQEWEQTLTDKYAELAEMRTKLEEFESGLDLRQAELLRDEDAREEQLRQGWSDLAKLLEGGDADENAVLLADYEPADAARILRALPEAAAGEILRLIEPPSLRKEFMDAYRASTKAP